jgi:hypothetical protein
MIVIMSQHGDLWQAVAAMKEHAMIRLTFLACLLVSPAMAQDQAASHKHMMHQGAMVPQEGGQSAFAAIQEITGILMADPTTDWPKVDIEALRQHLIDMNNVTLGAQVAATAADNGVKFTVSGDGDIRASIRRMVLAHASAMNGVNGWAFLAAETAGGAEITARPPPGVSVDQVNGLGFIGIMTLGMHHQAHHLMLAKGQQPHD